MTDHQFEVLSGKLDCLVKLAALGLVGEKKQREQIAVLARAGLGRREIAGIVGTTANTVSVELSKMKAGGSSRRKASPVREQEA